MRLSHTYHLFSQQASRVCAKYGIVEMPLIFFNDNYKGLFHPVSIRFWLILADAVESL